MKKFIFILVVTFFAVMSGVRAQDNTNVAVDSTYGANINTGSNSSNGIYGAILFLQNFKELFQTQGEELETGNIGNFLKEDISIYPNPTSDFVNVRLLRDGFAKICLLNIFGQVISSAVASGEMKIPVSEFDVGIYLLRVNQFTFRIIIQR